MSVLMLACMGGGWLLWRLQPAAVVVPEVVSWRLFFKTYLAGMLPEVRETSVPAEPPMVVRRPFGVDRSLAEHWRLPGNRDSAGREVVAMADGWVSMAEDFMGEMGGVVFIVHRMPEGWNPALVESVYLGLGRLDVKAGEMVRRGQVLGVVGRLADDLVPSLAVEVRTEVGLGLGWGESEDTTGWMDPAVFRKVGQRP
jgi:hypothetical protein